MIRFHTCTKMYLSSLAFLSYDFYESILHFLIFTFWNDFTFFQLCFSFFISLVWLSYFWLWKGHLLEPISIAWDLFSSLLFASKKGNSPSKNFLSNGRERETEKTFDYYHAAHNFDQRPWKITNRANKFLWKRIHNEEYVSLVSIYCNLKLRLRKAYNYNFEDLIS